jgi:hypothetical protein
MTSRDSAPDRASRLASWWFAAAFVVLSIAAYASLSQGYTTVSVFAGAVAAFCFYLAFIAPRAWRKIALEVLVPWW